MNEETRFTCKPLGERELTLHAQSLVRALQTAWAASFNAPLGEAEAQARYEDMRRYSAAGSALLYGAFAGDALAGFVWAYQRETPEGLRLHVTEFAVLPAYAGQGAGRLLLRAVRKSAAALGIEAVELMVSVQNSGAVGFYEHVGFRTERLCMVCEAEDEEEG